eukprot:3567421-Alexandrium_andersonii.AAC.1
MVMRTPVAHLAARPLAAPPERPRPVPHPQTERVANHMVAGFCCLALGAARAQQEEQSTRKATAAAKTPAAFSKTTRANTTIVVTTTHQTASSDVREAAGWQKVGATTWAQPNVAKSVRGDSRGDPLRSQRVECCSLTQRAALTSATH